MDEQQFHDALLAVRPRLTGGELRVALARRAGHVTHFDIKRETGLRLERVIAAEKSLCTKCAVILLRNIGLYNKYNPKEAAQNVQMPPSQQALAYLLRSLGREPVPHAADYKGFSKAYDIAYQHAGRNHLEALLLIKDTIDMELEGFKRSKYPGAYLPRLVDTYLSGMPKMTRAEIENQELIGKRLVWDPKIKQRRLAK